MLFKFFLQVENQSPTPLNTDPLQFIGCYNNDGCPFREGDTKRYEVPCAPLQPRSWSLIGCHLLPCLQSNSLVLLKGHSATNALVQIQ